MSVIVGTGTTQDQVIAFTLFVTLLYTLQHGAVAGLAGLPPHQAHTGKLGSSR